MTPKKKIIPKSLLPSDKSFIIKEIVEAYFDPTFHQHPDYQISYVVQGEGKRFIGNNVKSFEEDEVTLLGANIPHVWKSNSIYFNKNSQLNTKVIVIYFSTDIFGENLYSKTEFKKIKNLLSSSMKGVEIKGETKVKVQKLMLELLHKKEFDGILCLLEILHIISTSKEISFIKEASTSAFSTECEASRLNTIFEYTMKNFNKKIHIEEVAELAHMTNTSFSRYFKSRTNKSYSDFLTEIRIDYACRLLKKETITIERISFESGFPSVNNFNKLFKKNKGKTPREYRAEFLTI